MITIDLNPIDWLDIFEKIDIEKKLTPSVYITNSIKQKKNYYNQASFHLTIEYLHKLKEDTFYLSDERTLQFLNQTKLERPTYPKSESNLHNQTVFNSQLH